MSFVIQTGKTVEEAVKKALNDLRCKREDVEIEVLEEPSKGFLGFLGSRDATVKVSKIVKTEDLLKEILYDIPETPKEKKEKKEKKPVPREEKKPAPKAEEDKKPAPEKKPEEEDQVQEAPIEERLAAAAARDAAKEAAAKARKEEQLQEEPEVSLDEDTKILQEKKIQEFLAEVMKSLELDYSLDIWRTSGVIHVNINGEPDKMGIIIGKRGATLDALQFLLTILVNRESKKYTRVYLNTSGYREKRERTLEQLAEKMATKVIKTNRQVRLEPMNAAERRIIHATLQKFEGVSTHSEGRDPFRRVIIQREWEKKY